MYYDELATLERPKRKNQTKPYLNLKKVWEVFLWLTITTEENRRCQGKFVGSLSMWILLQIQKKITRFFLRKRYFVKPSNFTNIWYHSFFLKKVFVRLMKSWLKVKKTGIELFLWKTENSSFITIIGNWSEHKFVKPRRAWKSKNKIKKK